MAAGSALTGAGSSGPTGGFSDPTGGLFHERDSASENPTIAVTNGIEGTLTLVLRSPEGKEYSVKSQSGEEARMQVPPGRYTLSVSCDAPYVQPNYGDATFKRYKQYEAYFVLNENAPPVHLGD